MRESVSFDRAASFYERTRAMHPASADAITNAIITQLEEAAAESLLEVGIGTGLISRPLLARSIPVTGVDISSKMMSHLLDHLSTESLQPDLILGDATRLPFRDGSFPAALTVHVLHLVSDPLAALAEFRRVLSPGGVYLHKVLFTNEILADSSVWWDEALTRHGHPPLRRLPFEHLRKLIASTGAELDLIDVAHDTVTHNTTDILETTRNRIHSWTWQIADDIFDDCLAEYEPWFHTHYPAEIVEELTHELEIWRWPA